MLDDPSMTVTPATDRASPASVAVIVLVGVVILVGLAFGLRDAWVTGAGINGNWVSGGMIAAFSVVPIASVGVCIGISLRHSRSRSSLLMRAGVVGLAVGFPVMLITLIGAAY